MSLISVKVKKARFVCEEAETFNSYVTLKLQNVKSTTVTVKGANPSWEQDFLFETNNMNAGILAEAWCKGFLWDHFLGYYYIPLSEVTYKKEEGCGQWVSLDAELEMRGAEIIGTKKPTSHSLLIDYRLEPPFDAQNMGAAELQRKLEMLNNIAMDTQEAQVEQARRPNLYNIGHSGYSEDSDYTSDLNYPVGGQGANSSASQFRSAANQLATPQRSLETSRENSYERDDYQIPSFVRGMGITGKSEYTGHSPRYDEPYPEEYPPQRYSHNQQASETEPLFYNSRPRNYKEYRRPKRTWDYEDSQDGWYSEGYDYPNTRLDETRIYSDTEYYPSATTNSRRRGKGPHRRPSLERQRTLYDEHSHYADGYSSDSRMGKMSATYPECHTDIRYNEYYDTITGYVYQDERYGQDDEDRQWDSGGKWYPGSSIYYENKRNRKTLPQRPASSIGIHRPDYRPAVTRQRSYESEEVDYSSSRRKIQPHRNALSRQEGTGKKLPPTPTKPSSVVISRKLASLPATPSRQLPKTRTPSEESYYKSEYNEDYNYAYRSQDNLPQDTYTDNIYEQSNVVQDQVRVVGKTRYPEILQDNQYSTSYVPQVVDKYKDEYNQPYQEPQQDGYEQTYLQNSFKDDYQFYGEENSRQVYQDTYQESTYPISSQANDQYDKGGVIIEDNYQGMSYDQNNVQYQQPYKQDSYQQYDDYGVAVPSSIYDQNNLTTNAYNQYQQEQYDSQYNITTTSTAGEGFPEIYQESYGSVVPVTSQDNYQETYNKQEDFVDYRMSYNKEEEIPDAYKNDYQDQYQEYQSQYDESYQNSYQGSFDEQYKQSSAISDRRQSEVPALSITTPKGQTRANGYTPSETECYYSPPDGQESSPVGSARKKKLGRRDASPLLQQNTDSLESRDDELKDSFETAVSSVGSSQPVKGFNEYSAAGDSSPAAGASSATLMESPQSSAQQSSNTLTNHVSMANHVSTSMTVTAMIHSSAMNGKRLARTESYQEDVLEDDEYPEIIQSEPRRKDSQMSQQSQHSQQSQQHSQKPKLTRRDSYVSEYPEDSYSRKDSYAQQGRRESFSSKDGFKPPLLRTDSYQGRGNGYTVPQPISRAESFQRGYFKDQDSIDEAEISLSNAVNGDYKMREETLERYERGEEAMIRNSRDNSLVEPYKATPPMSSVDSPRGSVTKQASLEESVQMDTPPRSPPEPPPDEELLDMVGAAPVPTQLKERQAMSARQRWHWAYNQIIMQLNVSTDSFFPPSACEVVRTTPVSLLIKYERSARINCRLFAIRWPVAM